MEAVPISRSRKAGRDAINNIHGGIPLSVSGFLCFSPLFSCFYYTYKQGSFQGEVFPDVRRRAESLVLKTEEFLDTI